MFELLNEYHVLYWPLYFGIIAIALVLLNYKRMSTLGWLIASYVLFSSIIEYLGAVMAETSTNNHFLFHYYVPGSFLLLGIFFHLLYRQFGWNRYWNWGMVVAGVILIVLNSIFLQPIDTVNSYALVGTKLVLIGLSIAAFIGFTIKEKQLEQAGALKVFVASILLSAASSIIVYLFEDFIAGMERERQVTIFLFITFGNVISAFLWIVSVLLISYCAEGIAVTRKDSVL